MIKEKNFVSAVVYVHNDQDSVGSFLEGLLEAFEDCFENFEVVIVDDFSSDGSMSVAREACAQRNAGNVTVVTMSFYHGVEFAMRAGTDLSIGDYVFEFDTIAYGFDSELMLSLYQKVLEGNDVVSATPLKSKAWSSKFFYKVFNRAAKLSNDIDTEASRVLSRRAINRVSGANRSIPYRKAAYANSGLPVRHVEFEPKKVMGGGISQEEKRYRSNLGMDALILFTHTGYRIAVGLSVLMMVFAVVVAIYSLAVYFASGTVVGWTTTILFLSFGFFCLFGVLAFVIKYLQVLVDLVFKKQDYNFEKIERF